MISEIIDLLNYLGLTKEAMVPLLVAGAILYFFINKNIEKKINELKQELNHLRQEINNLKDRMSSLEKELNNLKKEINHLKDRMSDIENCIIEMQAILKNKYNLFFTRTVTNKYGQSNSPLSLKPQYKKFITDVGLDKQIEDQKDELVQWLKDKKPKSGLEAQDYIEILVISQEIEKYLDLVKYEQNLYEKGKTSEDAVGILTVYLYEVLIPQLKFNFSK